MLDELIVFLITDDVQYGVELGFNPFDCLDFGLVQQCGTNCTFVEVVVVEEEMKHLLDARDQPTLFFRTPKRPWIS